MRNILLSAILLVLGACATQTFKPDQAPEYTITRNFTPFYQKRPVEGATTDVSLSAKTRVKVLRKEIGYSLVQLEDSRTGYVSNKNLAVSPPGTQKKPFGSTSSESQVKPRRKKRPAPALGPAPSPSPVSEGSQSAPPPEETVPPPAPPPQVRPQESPVPTPAPTPQAPPLEKPKFRL